MAPVKQTLARFKPTLRGAINNCTLTNTFITQSSFQTLSYKYSVQQAHIIVSGYSLSATRFSLSVIITPQQETIKLSFVIFKKILAFLSFRLRLYNLSPPLHSSSIWL